MTFASPWVLALLLPFLPLAVFAARERERRRRRALDAFGDAQLVGPLSALPSGRRLALTATLAIVAGALSLIALARPLGGTGSRGVSGEGADVLFMLDLSRSMTATDVAPSRLAAAKAAVRAVAAALPHDRVGLVVFAGDGFLQLPATVDRSTFDAFVDAASPADVPDPATNLEAAADMAVNVVHTSDAPGSTALVVISDGEDNEGKLEGAIRALESAHLRTFTIGVGTSEGAAISGDVTTHLVEDNLRDIARRTGGVYAHWSGASSVAPVVAGLAQVPPRAIAGTARVAGIDRYQWPLALAFLLLLVR
jgi:Ca-activated chloride channel homolog